MREFVACSCFLIFAAVPASLQGQVLQAGDRVRIVLPEAQAQDETPLMRQFILRGTLTRLAAETLYVRPPGVPSALAVPNAVALTIHVSKGVRSRARSAARAGFLAALLGATFTGFTYEEPGHMYGVINRSEAIALGAGFGAVFGGLWGVVFPTERWQRVTN